MTIGIFGGSFNPVHVAHQLAALYVLETQPLDQLWFVPTYTHVFGKQLAAYDHRVAMCELAAAPLGPRVVVSRAEEELARRPGFVASRTLDLLEHLEQALPGERFRLVIGTDILGETAKWYRWDEVVAKAPPLVIGRRGHAAPAGVEVTGLAMPEVSATRIRELLEAASTGGGEGATTSALRSLVPASVLGYIARHGLYS